MIISYQLLLLEFSAKVLKVIKVISIVWKIRAWELFESEITSDVVKGHNNVLKVSRLLVVNHLVRFWSDWSACAALSRCSGAKCLLFL